MIVVEAIGTGPRVVLLHGFTQNRRCWPILAEDLAADHEVVLVDLPGHGEAPPVGAPVAETAERLASEIGPAVWVGYSMGGRHALHVAIDHADAALGLVTIGATAGIDDEVARRQRQADDDDRAIDVMLNGVEDFVGRWVKLPLFEGIPSGRLCVEERLDNTVEGLASSLSLAGTGSQASLWDRLGEGSAPLVAMAGATDEKFAGLAERLVSGWGGPSRLEIVPDCTHAVHLITPSAVAAAVRSLTNSRS